MKKIIKFGLSLILAVAMLISPIQSMAASSKEYISEVYVSMAKTADSAKKWLTDNGYQVLDKDLNEGTGKNFVYLGYKTTTDPNKAITDISVMDMKGGYSYAEYETLIKEQTKRVSAEVKELKKTIVEFRENYKEGSPFALFAYKVLNSYKEDDSGKLVGDFMLDEKTTDEQLETLFLQGNSSIFYSIKYALGLGCYKKGADSMLQELSKLDPEGDYPASLDDKAGAILKQWDELRTALLDYKKNDVKVDDSKTEVTNYVEELSSKEAYQYAKVGSIYSVMESLKYGDESMLSFFLTPAKDLMKQDLYPLASLFSDGQYVVLPTVGLMSMIGNNNTQETVDNIVKTGEKCVKESGESVTKIASVYDGVDRNVFKGGIALTTEALTKSKANNEDALIGNGSLGFYIPFFFLGLMSAFATIVLTVQYMMTLYEAAVLMTDAAYANFTFADIIAEAVIEGGTPGAYPAITFGVTCLIIGIYVGYEVYNYYFPTYTEIPKIIVDEKKISDDEVKYITYYATKETVDGEGATETKHGQYADLNGWAGKQWNAVYTTKDSAAGKPITADSLKVKTGTRTADDGYTGVHMFHENVAFNLNNHAYSDDVNGIYLFYEQDENAFNTTTGTVLATGNIAWIGGAGVIIGIVAGTLITLLINKKKKDGSNEVCGSEKEETKQNK